MMSFDERGLVADLRKIPNDGRVAFAAACAERLMPAYERFSQRTGWGGDPKKLICILDGLWNDLAAHSWTDFEAAAHLEVCMSLIPSEDDQPWVEEQEAAEDGAAAVAYALRCRQSGDAQEAAWAARRAYEALDHFVINREGIDTNRPGGEQRVLAHPLIQAELARQRRDLDELVAAEDLAAAISRIRPRAQAEAATVFGVTS